MVTDFQAAWAELMYRVATGGADGKKTSWGQNELLQEMGKIQGEKQVSEDLLEAATRLTGFPYTIQAAGTTPPIGSDPASESDMDAAHRPPNDQGGHDGSASNPGDSGDRNGRASPTCA